jgi:hypothetical protein
VLLTQQQAPSGDALFTVRQQIPVDVANPLFQDGHRLVPSVTRTFARDRPLHIFLEAYPGTPGLLAAWVAFYRDDRLAFQTRVHVIEEKGIAPRGAVPIRLVVPLASLASGEYTCQVTVLGPASGRATFWRAVVAIAAGG